jgi:L-alanine-DL-glutamate epimerase-like enolase superfamily enzyme
MIDRRRFLRNSAISAAMLARPSGLAQAATMPIATSDSETVAAKLDHILKQPVLDLRSVRQPVIIDSIQLLQNDTSYLMRIRSKDGLEAVTVPHQAKMAFAWPVLLKSVVPTFIGQDARDLESLLREVYRSASNYKMQGLIYWVAIAAVEMAILELMAQAAKCPLAHFFGGTLKRDIDVYFASGNRGNTPEEEIAYLQRMVQGSGVKAIKFRLGGRMSRNQDWPADRTERLIPLARQTFGEGMTLYGDSNSSYDADEGKRIGKLMEEYRYGFYEEPCEFDDLWSTKQVADALSIPVAGGEQEYSLHRWKWMIANRAVDIVQPDLHYGGGFIRATMVARMAEAAGLTVVPHMSGGGLSHVDVVQFASFTPNIGPYMEFKGNTRLPIHCPTSSLRCENGIVRCPEGFGWGIQVDADFISKSRPVQL